jgi:hypothetical protein
VRSSPALGAYAQDDFPELLSSPHTFECLRVLRKRKDGIHNWSNLVLLDSGKHRCEISIAPHRCSDNAELAPKDAMHIEHGHPAERRPVEDDPSSGIGQSDELVERLSATAIDDEIETTNAPSKRIGPRRLCVKHATIGAQR